MLISVFEYCYKSQNNIVLRNEIKIETDHFLYLGRNGQKKTKNSWTFILQNQQKLAHSDQTLQARHLKGKYIQNLKTYKCFSKDIFVNSAA